MHSQGSSLRCWLCWLFGVIALFAITCRAAIQAAPATESASRLLDDLGEGLFGPSESQPPAGDAKPNLKSQGLPAAGQLPQLAPPAGSDIGQPSGSSPLANIASNMQQAERLIFQQNLTGQTAQVQEQVLADLDQLIKQSERPSQNQSSSQSQSQSQQQASQRSTPQASQGGQPAGQRTPGPSAAARTSSDRVQSSPIGDAAALGPQEALKDVWGQLPERVRQQLLQSSTDEFLPEYREEIERYFRRLSEEESRTRR